MKYWVHTDGPDCGFHPLKAETIEGAIAELREMVIKGLFRGYETLDLVAAYSEIKVAEEWRRTRDAVDADRVRIERESAAAQEQMARDRIEYERLKKKFEGGT